MAIEHYDEAYRANIRDYLIRRAHAVRVDAKLNLLNLAGLSEDFYAEFINILLDLQLENANAKERNKAGIDLIDCNNRVVAQVSATCAPNTIRKKIRNSIEKFKIPEGEPWQFYFVPITDQAPDLKSGFDLPDGLIFDESKDVLDIARIMELAKGVDKLRNLSELVDKYSKGEALRKNLDELLLRTWKAHRSYKLMQTDEIDKRLFPNIRDSRQFEVLGKRTEHDSESPVWSIIRESWNEPTNRPVMIQGKGGIGKTVTLFSLTRMDKDAIPAPAVYVPMFELVDQEGNVVNLAEYFQSANSFLSLAPSQRNELCTLASEEWNKGPKLLVLLDGFNEVPGNHRWNVLRMLRTWHYKNPGAQLIAVSRPMDNLSLETAFGEETISITLSELTRKSVEAYLKSSQGNGVRVPSPEEPIWETIVYPLFLNLYIKTDKLRGQQVWKDYPLDVREAVGPGCLIWNYLQRELLRREDDAWILRCAVACEYLAPILAHHMIQRYDYTISQRDAIAVIQKAVSEMDLERMPSHLAEIFSWWGYQSLSVEPPTFLKDLDWTEIVLREIGMIVTYQESHAKKNENRLEKSYEFLHQNFRDCLAGVYLVNQAEMAQENMFPDIWGRSQSYLALNYAAELIDTNTYGQLWETNRKGQAYGISGSKKNHTATCNLLELWKRNKHLTKELDFSGMDLRGFSLTHYLGKDGWTLPLFQKSCLSKDTLLDRSVFESEGHTRPINVLAVLLDGLVVSGSDDNTLRVWDATTGQCLQTLKGHTQRVCCVAALPEGYVVSGSCDNTLRVWNVVTGQCLHTLEGHIEDINCISVLPDGYVVSGSKDSTLRVWDTATGQCLQTIKGHTSSVNCVAAFPDGRVVSGSNDNTLMVWDTATGKCLQILKGHCFGVSCVAVFPDGRVVSGSNDFTLRVWDATTGKCLHILEQHSNMVNCVAVLSNGLVVSGSCDNSLRVWNAVTGCCLQTLEGHIGEVSCVAVLPDGRVVSGSRDHALRLWDPTTGKCLKTLEGHTDCVNYIAILPDGHVVSASQDNSLRVWDVAIEKCLQILEGHICGVTCTAVLPNKRMVSGSSDNILRVWDIDKGQYLHALGKHINWIVCIAALPDDRVVSSSWDGSLWVWDVVTGQRLKALEGHTNLVYCLAALPDGRVVSGSWDNTLRVWDVATGQCLKTLEGHTNLVYCLAVLPDGRVVSGSWDNTLRVWDATTGQCLQTLKESTNAHLCVAALSDGSVVSSSWDSALRVWDTTTGQCLQTLNGHTNLVFCLAVLPDGRVVSGSHDSTVRVWDATTGRCLQTLEGHTSRVNCISILPDGRVASGSRDGTMRVWDPDTGACLHVLEAMEVQVSREKKFKMNFSDAIVSDDLARLLWHNGATIPLDDKDHCVTAIRKKDCL